MKNLTLENIPLIHLSENELIEIHGGRFAQDAGTLIRACYLYTSEYIFGDSTTAYLKFGATLITKKPELK